MKRELAGLSENKYDILIIGGGIYGATLLWRASIAGYSAALIEKNDFGSGTSSNSQKIIHGGLRYLQNLDFRRVRQSINERKRLMWLAPHLVSPLACIMPLFGHKLKGKEALFAGIKLYDMISADRNNIPDRSKYITSGKILSKDKIIDLIPGLEQTSLKGGVLWYDAFCKNTERLIVSFIKSAVNCGNVAANYIKAEKLITKNNTVKGVIAWDRLTQRYYQIEAEKVVACTGAESNGFITYTDNSQQGYVAGINVIVKKIFSHDYAVGIENKKSKRLYFVAPWKGKSILGTDWYPAPEPEKFEFEKTHIKNLIDNFNITYPVANLSYGDVEFVHQGFVPASNDFQNISSTLSHFKIINGGKFGLDGFYKIVGVKYTTAMNVAENFLKMTFPGFKELSLSSQPKLLGGEINDMTEFSNQIYMKYQTNYSREELSDLICDFGSEVDKVIGQLGVTSDNTELSNNYNNLLEARVLFAIKEEMAIHLDDVVFRRTGIGSIGPPDDPDLRLISKIMSEELKWDESQRIEEIKKVKNYYSLLSEV